MDEAAEAKTFLITVRQALPGASLRTDSLIRLRGGEPQEYNKMPHLWLEALADITNQDIAERNEVEVRSQVGFMAQQFQNCLLYTSDAADE